MNIKEILDSEVTQKHIEERIVREGNLVLQVISSPGWDLVLGSLLMAKINAEKSRRSAVSKQTTREMSLYWNGIVDGIEEAKEAIYRVVKAAEEVKKNRADREGMEDL